MKAIVLVLELFLPGNATPIHGELDMPSLEVCIARAERFIKTFDTENPEGGQAMAGCIVKIPPKRES